MLRISYQNISNSLFSLSLCGMILTGSLLSPTHAMNLEQNELCKLTGRVVQPAEPLPMESSLKFLKENPKWQPRERFAKGLKMCLSPEGIEKLKNSNTAIQILVDTKENDKLRIQIYENTPEFFNIKPKSESWSNTYFKRQNDNTTWMVLISGARYDLYKDEEASQVRYHLNANASVVLPKLDECSSNNPAVSYPILLTLTPVEKLCLKYTRFFPNLIFEKTVEEEELKLHHTLYTTATKKLTSIEENRDHAANLLLCTQGLLPSEISDILLRLFLLKKFQISIEKQ